MNYPVAQKAMVHLPSEVLSLVVIYIRVSRSAKAAQHDLWSLCLVSKDWYASSIRYLYEAPVLSSRNFVEFARTISPPLSSRARRIGLEDFVEHLNMGSLAYESKKSTTSRLISRTKKSLKAFIAPAVSFSTTSLAPLSKCVNLELLDLSRDVYDFSLLQLLRSVRSLSRLAYLNLPKNAGTFQFVPQMEEMKTSFWSPNLICLQLNDADMQPTTSDWTSFLKSLPPNLTTLSLRNLDEFDSFDEVMYVEGVADQVRTLSVGVRVSDTSHGFWLFLPFPNLSKMVVPAMTIWIIAPSLSLSPNYTYTLGPTGSKLPTSPQNLEVLVLEESPDFTASSHIRVAHLKDFVEHCPRLMRIEVPEAYLNIEEEDDSELDDINQTLTERATKLRGGSRAIDAARAGIFMTESNPRAGVGLKRSFRYRGDR